VVVYAWASTPAQSAGGLRGSEGRNPDALDIDISDPPLCNVRAGGGIA